MLGQPKALQNETDTEQDPSYVASNFIFLNKLQGMGCTWTATAGSAGR